MALINCPECNAEVSDKAPTCPRCGAPVAAPMSKRARKAMDKEAKKERTTKLGKIHQRG